MQQLLSSQLKSLAMALCGLLLGASPGLAANLETGAPAPAFTLPALTGNSGQIGLANYRGQVVYIDFWASWCGPCRKSLPQLNILHAELKERGFVVIAVNVDEFIEDALEFLERYPVDYPLVHDPAGATAELYKLRGMPTSFLVAKDGRLSHIHEGFRDGDTDNIKARVLELLKE